MRRPKHRTPSQDVIVSGFHDLEPIGEGGFSRVYRARQTGLEREVALKLLDGGFDTAAKQKSFERECRAMGALSRHPNIVTVFSAAFSAEGRPCIVMEFYEDGTLGERVKQHGPLDLATAIDVGQKLCGALDAAHGAGIIHRDIKPQNLFASAYSSVVLGDFGISSFEEDRTVTRSNSGLTVHYAPPELIEGGTASAQSDIYSLAATLHYLVSGERPFPRGPGETIGDVARRILIQPAPIFDRNGPGRGLGLILASAMSKDPSDRPVTAAALGEALAALGSVAATPPVVTKLRKQVVETNDDATSATIMRANPAIAPPEVVEDEERTNGFSQRSRSLLVGSAAIVIFIALLGFFGLRESPDEEPRTAPTSTTAGGSDSFFGAPTTPRGVGITTTEAGFEVSWEPVDGAIDYEVIRIDTDRAVTRNATSPFLIAAGVDERPCVAVRAVGEGGLLSLDSATVCS